MGGDCLNFGCVPSKALIASGKAAHAMTKSKPFGVTPVTPQVNYSATKTHVNRVIKGIAPHDSVERFEGLGVKVIQAYGAFISRNEVKAGDYIIKARRFVISTGSSPFVPPINGLDKTPYYTNETIFKLKDHPKHLIIIGGGPIGLEMAQAHIRLGCQVTVLEGLKALGRDDPELASIALKSLKAEGVKIIEGAIASEISGKKGDITIKTKDGKTYQGSHLLMAVGRRANIDKLDLEKAGIETTRSGIKTDASLKTTNRKVYAIGDVAGGLQFTHVAGYHAGIVVKSALFGLSAKASHNHIPWATYIDPEMAHVGLSHEQAKERYGTKKLEVVRFPYQENDRARADLATTGLIKLMVYKGKPVGASIVGAHAGELITTWSLAIANGLKMSAIVNMVAPYPTYAEINKRVAGAYFANKLFHSNAIKRFIRFVQRF